MTDFADIFISYRRNDAAGYAGRIYDALTASLGGGAVFFDFETLVPGRGYPHAIEEAIAQCRVMLAVIGPAWLDARASAGGERRLDDPEDLVRRELAQALALGRVVIPVLVRRACMPDPDQLPLPLRELAFAHAIELHDAAWTESIAALVDAIGSAFGHRRVEDGVVEPTTRDLPKSLTSFVGRDDMLGRVVEATLTTRLVTVTGTGGIGKTRLVVEAAHRLLTSFDAVWFVDLAAVSRPVDVPAAVATSLGIRTRGGESYSEAIGRQLEYRHALVVLDNCEHVVAAAAQIISSITQDCAEMHVLATSRVPLLVAGERVMRLEPLPCPVSGVDPSELSGCPAVQLLVDRIRLADPMLVVNAADAEALATICRELDGVPLALELAAARCRSMSVQEIADHLEHRFQLLTSGPRTVPDRQRTLSALVQWSYDLLDENERLALCQLSVFAGGWDLVGAGRVIDVGNADTASLLASLIDNSLVEREPIDAGSRYRLLETIRAFAAERLMAAGGKIALEAQLRHRDYLLDLSEGAASHIEDAEFDGWLAKLAIDNDNLRAALVFTLDAEDGTPVALRFARALEEYWIVSGQCRVGADFISAALASALKASDADRRPAIVTLGRLLDVLAQYEASVSALGEVLEQGPNQNDEQVLVRAYIVHAGSQGRRGRLDEARASARAAVALAEQQSSTRDRVKSLVVSGFVEYAALDMKRARDFYERAIALAEPGGDKRALASALNNLALIEVGEENFDHAERLLERAVSARGTTFHDDHGSAIESLNLGLVAAMRRDFERAQGHYRTALRLAVRCGMEEEIAYGALGLAVSATPGQDEDRTARLLGVADGIMERLDVEFEPLEASLRTLCHSALIAALGGADFDEAYAAGRQMPHRDAVRFAGLS